jgi:hypothetical protein
MNLREENNAGFLALLEVAGETLIDPDGKERRGLVTNPALDSEFIPGAEMLNQTIRVRFFGKVCDDLQTIWKIRGSEMRLVRLENFGPNTLATFEDADN